MSQQISLKQAERHVFKTAVNDGLWDIFIGCIVLQFAIAPLLSVRLGDFWSSAVFLPLWAMVYAGIVLIKKYIVKPRIGFVKFGQSRKRKLKKFTLIMLIANVAAFILGLVFAYKAGAKPGFMPMIVLGFIVLLASSLAAYLLNLNRLFLYGVLFALSLFTGEWLFAHYRIAHHGFPITFGITAGIIITTGIVIFIRLIRQYPVVVDDETAVENNG